MRFGVGIGGGVAEGCRNFRGKGRAAESLSLKPPCFGVLSERRKGPGGPSIHSPALSLPTRRPFPFFPASR